MHTVHRVTVQLPGSPLREEVQVEVAARLASELLIGSHCEMAVDVSRMHCRSPVGLLDLRLTATNARRLRIVHLRSQQLHLPLQNAERLLQHRPLQTLVDLMRAAACPGGAPPQVSWYMLMASLVSAVAVGEDQRQGKIKTGERHRCQVMPGHHDVGQIGRQGGCHILVNTRMCSENLHPMCRCTCCGQGKAWTLVSAASSITQLRSALLLLTLRH